MINSLASRSRQPTLLLLLAAGVAVVFSWLFSETTCIVMADVDKSASCYVSGETTQSNLDGVDELNLPVHPSSHASFPPFTTPIVKQINVHDWISTPHIRPPIA